MKLSTVAAPAEVIRAGRAPDVWVWREWGDRNPDGTFGHRWDDPRGEYRVLYTAAARLGALVEVLQKFRPDVHLYADIRRVRRNDRSAPVTSAAGLIPSSWRRKLAVGSGRPHVDGKLAAVAEAESLTVLREAFADEVDGFGVTDVNAETVRSKKRPLTQHVSRFVYDYDGGSGSPLSGIFYRSWLGDEIRNYAFFEREPDLHLVTSTRTEGLSHDDPDWQEACRILGLQEVADAQ